MYLSGNVDYDLKTVAREKPWLIRGSEPGDLSPTPEIDCHAVLTGTGKTGGHSGEIALRCMCQAGTYRKPSAKFYGYDPLAVVGSIAEAATAWKAHCAGRKAPRVDVYL